MQRILTEQELHLKIQNGSATPEDVNELWGMINSKEKDLNSGGGY